MKKNSQRAISIALTVILGAAFLAVFGKAALLKAYLRMGVGNCQKVPVLCLGPDTEITDPPIDKNFKARLIPYEFPKMRISLPKGFDVVQEEIKKFASGKKERKNSYPVAYLLYEKPGFFPGLFPRLAKQGVLDNYLFISRTLHAQTAKTQTLVDAFFIIMKSIFTPNLGDEKDIKIIKFYTPGHKGYITYNLSGSQNYFDCNVVDSEGGFFKIYIKDKEKTLDLNKVFTIISTAKRVG